MDITVYNLPLQAYNKLKNKLSNIVDDSHIFSASNESVNKTYIEIKIYVTVKIKKTSFKILYQMI